jgi:NADPH-dependent ferric siderophore reductase
MPRFPAAVARLFEARGIPSTVDRIEDLSPRFRRVHLAGDGLRGHAWAPCQVISFRVTATEFRHYTPDAFDSAAGRMSILFYRHSAGSTAELPPGEAWLDGLVVGDPVTALGPGAARGFRARTGPATVLVCGDATTVGLWHSMIGWSGTGTTLFGVVEVPAQDVPLVRELLPGVDVVPQAGPPGTALVTWLNGAPPTGVTHAYLAGHGQTIQRARDLLRSRCGLQRSAISTQPYWATGKTGL